MPICYLPRIERVPAMFEALANANRRSMLHFAAISNISATDMAKDIGISQQAASRHVLVLQRAGLLARHGWEVYGVDSGGIDELTSFIRAYFPCPDTYVRRAHWM